MLTESDTRLICVGKSYAVVDAHPVEQLLISYIHSTSYFPHIERKIQELSPCRLTEDKKAIRMLDSPGLWVP